MYDTRVIPQQTLPCIVKAVHTAQDYLKKKPEFVIEEAVRGMLPKTRLGEAIFKNLKVYAGAEHPHAAQNPKAIKLNEIK